jgi:uncharacterized membrane protein
MVVKKGRLYAVMLLLIMIGIVDAAYLTYSHYNGTPVACPDAGIVNCGKVLSSPYSTIFGIPLGFIGMVFFAIELFMLDRTDYENIMFFNIIGIATVVYLLYVEYVLGAICLYCTLVHILVVSLFVLSVYGYLREKKVSTKK